MTDVAIIDRLARYIIEARSRELPADVLVKTKHHILDTLAAMISGLQLKPGQKALEFARSQACDLREAHVIGTELKLPAISAAIVNGMLAHSDETDDSNGTASLHSGCVILPAALAMGEREGSSGADVVRAVALGYDVGARTNKVFGRNELRARGHLPYGIGGTMGATAAAGALAGLTEDQIPHLLSYGAQQASGVMTYARDTEHVEKAFVFAGMPARNGVTAATMIGLGFTGVDDVFSGPGNFFFAYAENPDPEAMVAELGERYEVMLTNIKKYPAGFPIQGALEALFGLLEEHPFRHDDVDRIVVRMRESGAYTVNDRPMPNINLQYMFALAILDGRIDFEAAHDVARMDAPEVRDLRSRISLVGDPMFSRPEDHSTAVVEVSLRDGAAVSRTVRSFRGKAENPLRTDEVEGKARDLIGPVLGAAGTEELITCVRDLETLPHIGELGRLATPR